MIDFTPKPTKLTLEQWGRKTTIEIDHSELNAEEMAEMISNLLKAGGWDGLIDIIAENLLELNPKEDDASAHT